MGAEAKIKFASIGRNQHLLPDLPPEECAKFVVEKDVPIAIVALLARDMGFYTNYLAVDDGINDFLMAFGDRVLGGGILTYIIGGWAAMTLADYKSNVKSPIDTRQLDSWLKFKPGLWVPTSAWAYGMGNDQGTHWSQFLSKEIEVLETVEVELWT